MARHRKSKNPHAERTPGAGIARFEPLEERILLSGALPTITAIEADNRGVVTLTASRDLDASTVNSGSVRIFTAGSDGLIGTADDTLLSRQVTYDSATRRIRVAAEVTADSRYRVVLDASVIKGTNNCFLDGEFNGAGKKTGNGVEGGNLEFFTRRAATTVARFTTSLGTIDVRLFAEETPLTVQNFLNYANRGAWDTTFFHRGARTATGPGPADFVIQGGGFSFAENSFPSIPQDPPVQNEPVFSNVRGTIAMAKLGGNPNSATNQWFFNLSNNSENLDNQNGGFTAFGEITTSAGLSVMDAIAALARFNASQQNGAFTDVPVRDLAAVESRGSLLPGDVAQVTRVAILVDLAAEPTQQLPVEGAIFIGDPNGSASVRVFDLDGVGLPNASEFISVSFGSRDKINQIKLLDGFPNARIGIQIFGSSGVGQIIDQRKNASGDVAFIVTNAGISSIKMNHAISGYDLNGFVLPGVTLPDDIDGDGRFNDPIAVYSPVGVLDLLDAKGGLNGDVFAPDGIRQVRAGGLVSNADFTARNSGANVPMASFQFGRVADSSIDTASPIASLRASEWRSVSAAGESISAPSIGTISITGDKKEGVAGDFEVNLDLFAPGNGGRALNSASIAGGLFRSMWDLAGSAGNLNVKGDISLWTADIAGSMGSINAGQVIASTLTVSTDLGSVRVDSWDGGAISARSTPQIVTTGDKKNGVDGDFSADVTLDNPGTRTRAISNFQVAGDFNGGVIRLTGQVNSLRVDGVTRDMDLESRGGNFATIQLGDVIGSEVSVFDGTVNRASALRWTGGALRVLTLNSVVMTGDARTGIAGDFFAEFLNVTLGSFALQNGGSFQGEFSVNGRANSVSIDGDVRSSSFSFSSNNPTEAPVLRTLRVGGAFTDSEFRSNLSVDSVSVGMMMNSGVYLGLTSQSTGLPDPGTNVITSSVLGQFQVRGMAGSTYGFQNSYVVAGTLRNAMIMEPRTDNFGTPFGVAAPEVGSVVTRIDNRNVVVNGGQAMPASVGDYQIRVALQLPNQS